MDKSQHKKQVKKLNILNDKNLPLIKKVIEKNNLITNKCINSQTKLNKNEMKQQLLLSQNWFDGIQKLEGGGVINDVYEIYDIYILKVQSFIPDITVHQVQLFELANKNKIKVPILIDYGQFFHTKYMLMSKMQGGRLWKYWLDLNQDQKQKCMYQICLQIKKFHNIAFNTYSPRRPWQFNSLYQAFSYYSNDYFSNINKNKQLIGKLDQHTLQNYNFIVKYVKQNIFILKQKLYEDEQPVFIHNDLHFGNILYDIQNHQVTGILDFDFSRQLTKDYELWRIIDVFFKPWRYAEDDYQEKWKCYQIQNQMKYLKKYYSQLFNCQKEILCSRLRLYLTQSLVDNLQYGHYEYFNQKVQSYYKSKWLQNLLY